MATVSTVPARSNKGPSGRRPRRRLGGRRWPPRGRPRRPRPQLSPEPLVTFRRFIRGLGKTLIATGVLIFLFVAYQLWGTGLAEARSQKSLAREFNRRLATLPTTLPGLPTPSGEAPTTAAPPVLGDAVAQLKIPKIGVDKFVREGVGVEDLKQGPGHYPGTPMPGEHGNAAIAGHRTTYGAPFSDLDKLEPGDDILVTTLAGSFRYQVDHLVVVSPSESSVLDDTPDNRLTLTTCNPKFSAAQRLIVVASLSTPLPEVAAPPTPSPEPPSPTPRLPGERQLAGLSGASTARGPAVAWGSLAAFVWLLSWWVGRRWRRWAAYLIGTPIFLLVLFMFFENFSRLLPANV